MFDFFKLITLLNSTTPPSQLETPLDIPKGKFLSDTMEPNYSYNALRHTHTHRQSHLYRQERLGRQRPAWLIRKKTSLVISVFLHGENPWFTSPQQELSQVWQALSVTLPLCLTHLLSLLLPSCFSLRYSTNSLFLSPVFSVCPQTAAGGTLTKISHGFTMVKL